MGNRINRLPTVPHRECRRSRGVTRRADRTPIQSSWGNLSRLSRPEYNVDYTSIIFLCLASRLDGGPVMARNNPRYLVDESGRKISVILAINEYRQLMEYLQDLAIIAERKDEPTESIREFKKDSNHDIRRFAPNVIART